jgi:hypothetical protein
MLQITKKATHFADGFGFALLPLLNPSADRQARTKEVDKTSF